MEKESLHESAPSARSRIHTSSKKNYARSFLRRHPFIITLSIIILIVGVWHMGVQQKQTENTVQYVTETVTRGTITSTVSGTGQIIESSSIHVTPEFSSTVSEVHVQEGQAVEKGDVLVILDQTSAYANLLQAQANLASAEESYEDVLDGTASEDLKITRVKIDTAKTTLENAQKSYQHTVEQQQTIVDNTYRSLLNSGISDGTGSSPVVMKPVTGNNSTATVKITGTYFGQKEGKYTLTLKIQNKKYTYKLSGIEEDEGVFTPGTTKKLGTYGLYFTVSDELNDSIENNSVWTLKLPNTQASSYLSQYNAYQSVLQSQTQAIDKAQNEIDVAESTILELEAELEKQLTDADSAEIISAEAQIATARAQVQDAQDDYDATIIAAPMAGVLADVAVVVGDQVSPSTLISTIITQENIVVLAVNEIDVPTIDVGDTVIITFDALEDVTLTGLVSHIDSVGTVDQGVVSYQVEIAFDTQNDRIKSGMTVNVELVTETKTDTLIVSDSAIKIEDDVSFVEILSDTRQLKRVPVTVGMSTDATSEIIDGLTEGDVVVIQTMSASEELDAQTTSTKEESSSKGFGGAVSSFHGGPPGGGF